MVKSRIWLRVVSTILIVSMLMGLAPLQVWAEAGDALRARLAMLQSQLETWSDGPDRTITPSYYTFDGAQVLDKRPDNVAQRRSGTGGSHLKMNDTETIFPAGAGQIELSWKDSLKEWIEGQGGEAINPPTGYEITIELENVLAKATYTLVSSRMDTNGTNRFVWNGKDDKGRELPDGYYYWHLKAEAPTVQFMFPPAEEGGEPVIKAFRAPAYGEEKQLVIIDRTAPEIIGVHPLGGGKLAVEAQDFVGGLEAITVQGVQSAPASWKDAPPLRAAVSVQPSGDETLQITVVDVAGNKAEEAVPLYPYVTGTGELDSIPSAEATVAAQDVRINLTTGNGLQRFDGFVQQNPGLDLSMFLTYNHQNRVNNSRLGFGWTFSIVSRLTKWADGNVTWVGFDGTLYWFKPIDEDHFETYANGQKQTYPMMYMMRGNSSDPDAFGLEWPNQLRYRFHNNGLLWLVQDRYTTEMDFDWDEVVTSYGKDYRIAKVTDGLSKQITTFTYRDDAEKNLKSAVIADMDALGNEIVSGKRKFTFLYNKKREFVGYIEPSQKVTRFVYDNLHRIRKVIDNGNSIVEEEGETSDSVTSEWTYDSQNRVTRMSSTRKQDNVEEFLGVQYGANSATAANPIGEFTLKWDDKLHAIERVDKVQTTSGEKQAKTSYAYSGNNLIRVTDPLNRVTRYKYNDFDNVIAEQSPSGRIVHYEYDQDQDFLGESGPLGHKVSIGYDKNVRKIKIKTTTTEVVDPAGINEDQKIVTVEEINDNGDVTKLTDANGNVFEYAYDSEGYLVSDGTRTTYKNDRNGNQTEITVDAGTPDEAVTRQTFNAQGWLTHRESPSGLVEDFEYDAWGRTTKVTQQDQADASKKIVRTYTYDDGGHLIEQSDGLNRTTYKVDGIGNVLSRQTEPLEAGTTGTVTETFSYNNQGQLVKHADARGETTETAYNVAGQPERMIVMPDNAVTIIEYDNAGRTKSITAPDGGRTSYTYDVWDRVLTQETTIRTIAPVNSPINVGSSEVTVVTEYKYDSAGRLVEEKLPNGAWTRYAYDGNGNRTSDTQGGPIPSWNGVPLSSGTSDTLYPGHEVLSTHSYTFDKLGRITTETDGNGNQTSYDYAGRTVKTSMPALQGSALITLTRQDSYDTAGNLVSTVNEAGETTTVAYDAFGHATLAVNEEGQETHYTTDPYGRTKQIVETVDRSGKTQTIRYDVDARGFVRGEQRQLGADKWATTSYTYTTAGDLLQTTDAAGLITSYMYDRHGRLKQQQETDTVTGSIRLTSYDYDVMGRQTAVVRPDGSHEISVYDTNGRQVLSIDGLNHATSYRYDEAGSLIEETQYKDGASDLIPANASATTRYVYNGVGNGVIMQDPNGNVTRQSFDRRRRIQQVVHLRRERSSALNHVQGPDVLVRIQRPRRCHGAYR